MTLIPTLPWLFSAATALCLALMARRAGQACFPWALLGGVSSLVITTITLGVAEARYIAISHDAGEIFCIKEIFVAILVNALFGWFVTTSLHHHHFVPVRFVKSLVDQALGRSKPLGPTIPKVGKSAKAPLRQSVLQDETA